MQMYISTCLTFFLSGDSKPDVFQYPFPDGFPKHLRTTVSIIPHTMHVGSCRYIYLHLPNKKSTIHVGKYTVRPMDSMG